MLEAELAFIDNIHVIIDEVELMVKYITKCVVNNCPSDIHAIGGNEPEWLNQKFACITYDEAFNILEENSKELQQPVTYGLAFPKEHELFLVKHNNNIPMFVINWPKGHKPFYMKECKDDTSKVRDLK